MPVRSILLVALAFISATANAQSFVQIGQQAQRQLTPSLVTQPANQYMPPPQQAPAPKWDYKWDAQYNSTIKPYLRWYHRPELTNGSQSYPYYYGPGAQFMRGGNYGYGNYGYGGYGYGQTVGGYSNYGMMSGGYQTGGCGNMVAYPMTNSIRPSSWFNPWAHLPNGYGQQMQQVMPQNYQIIYPEHLQKRVFDLEKFIGRKPTNKSRTKTAWLKRDPESGSLTILYKRPTNAEGFYQARVTLDSSYKVTSTDWIETPPWKVASR